MTMTMKTNKVWNRIKDLDRLSAYMNIAFGFSLLLVSIAFVTGNYIGEDNRFVNVIEIGLSISLIILGINRVAIWRKRRDIIRNIRQQTTMNEKEIKFVVDNFTSGRPD